MTGVGVVLLAMLVAAGGAALQGATGMGMALFAAPLLALLDRGFVPGPTLCAIFVLSAAVALRERAAIDGRILALALAGLVAGSGLGAVLLSLLAGIDLARVFAVMILLAVALSMAGLRLRTSAPALLAGGAASGVLGTMAGVQGPPIALVLQHEPPERLRPTLCAFFSAGSLISLLALWLAGLFGGHEIGLALWLLPGVPAGLWLAPALARRIDRRRARAAVLAISALSAAALLLRA